MYARLRSSLPELGIGILLLYFALRHLGSFPDPWTDEGLFVTLAKSVANGQGYAMPLLEQTWLYPYFLNVGPTLIYPSALSLALFGNTMEAARLPMVLYMILCTVLFYRFADRIGGKQNARWATLLLVTLSAFVNTGKPVLGEIPAFAFLLGGLLMLTHAPSWKRTAGSGVLFGLAFLTKITFGLILPALGLAWVVAIIRRDWREVRDITLMGLITLAVFVPWRILEMSHTLGSGLGEQLVNFLAGGDGSTLLYLIRFTPHVLAQIPYYAFATFLLFGSIGLWSTRTKINRTLWIVVVTLIALFTLYFVNGFGWYRLLLPAHLLLLPFVPLGAWVLLRPRPGMAALIVIVLLQGYWQWNYRGSSFTKFDKQTAEFVQREFSGKRLIIEQSEIFAQLPPSPDWLFLVPDITFGMPKEFNTVSGTLCQVPLLRKISTEDQALLKPEQLTPIAGRYFIIRDYPCPYTAQ